MTNPAPNGRYGAQVNEKGGKGKPPRHNSAGAKVVEHQPIEHPQITPARRHDQPPDHGHAQKVTRTPHRHDHGHAQV